MTFQYHVGHIEPHYFQFYWSSFATDLIVNFRLGTFLSIHRFLSLRRELPEPEPGARNFACGANYPYQALKGGYFIFVLSETLKRVDSTNLT